MSRYRWARSFVRQARWFAMLIVIVGLIFVGIHSWNLRNQISDKAYRPNVELTESLQDMSDTLQKSKDIISSFQKSSGGELIPPSIDTDLGLLPSYDSVANLAIAADQLATAKSSTNALKAFLLASVQQNLDDIVTQLRAHAATLTPPATAMSNLPTTPPQVTMTPGVRGLFADDVTTDEAEQRKSQLQQVQDLLGVLVQRTEKPENQAKLQSSVSEIGRLEGLLAYLTVPAELAATTANLQPVTNTNAPQQAVVAASKIADSLEASEGIIQDAITSKWLIDEKISDVEPIIIQEQQAAEEATSETNRLYTEFYENTFITLLITIIVAYLVQILADILQAHIDNADNSFQQNQYPPDVGQQ